MHRPQRSTFQLLIKWAPLGTQDEQAKLLDVGHKFSGSRMRFGVKCGPKLNNGEDFSATGAESGKLKAT